MTDHLPDVDTRLRALAATLPVSGDHPDEDTWVALQTGMVSDERRRAVADHIGTCPECAQVFRAIHQLTDEARGSGIAPDVAGVTSVARSRAFLLMAAGLLAALGLVVWLGTRISAPDSQAVAGGPPSPAPAAVPQPRQARAWALAVSAPAVELPARYALVTRGGDRDRAFLEAFGAAIAPYREGDYPRAATALADVRSRFPDVPEAAFYLGAARLFAGDAAGARAPLADATRAESLGETARWLGAVAAERTGAFGDADTALAALCDAAGAYRAQACAALGRSTTRE